MALRATREARSFVQRHAGYHRMAVRAHEQWRNLVPHRATQAFGRELAFADYRLRVAHVVRDYGMAEREQAPADSRARHDLPR
jgi:hypothetical protein